MSLEVFHPLQFFGWVWTSLTLILLQIFGRIHSWSHLVLGFCLPGGFWLLIQSSLWEDLCPAELSQPPQWEINCPRHNLVVLAGKGVAIPSGGEQLKPFSQMVFPGNCMCRGIPHTCIPHQSMSKGFSHTKTGIILDNNWRNTELCHRSGSVRHADARWSLWRVSWDKEFTSYALNIQFISTGPYKANQSKLRRIQYTFQAWSPRC